MRLTTMTWACTLGFLALGNVPALAQSTTCANLAADLESLNRRAPVYDPYGDAITRQKTSLDRAEADYQRFCSSNLFAKPMQQCPAMTERIQAMQANLDKLQRTAPKFQPKDDPNRARLINLMRQSHCDERPAGTISTSPPVQQLLNAGSPGSGLFGFPTQQRQTGTLTTNNPSQPGAPVTTSQSDGRTFILQGPDGPMLYREEANGRIVALGPPPRPSTTDRRSTIITTEPDVQRRSPDEADGSPDSDQSLAGTFRTLCVRTCDGYYFPVSYAASSNQFHNDADVCHARCPGTETRLFVVKSPGEDGEQSFAPDTGELYSKLPNALRYRREVVNACTCGRPDPALMPAASLPDVDRNADGSVKVSDLKSDLPTPIDRPNFSEDPETRANIAISFSPQPILQPSAVTAVAPEGLPGPQSPKTVRQVGPKFFADQ